MAAARRLASNAIGVTMNLLQSFPKTVDLSGHRVEFRLLTAGDEAALLAFARSLPVHDMLFLPRDISKPRVIEAWLHDAAAGSLRTLVVVRDGRILGCGAVTNDPLSWSKHVGSLRIVVASDARHFGLGRALLQEMFAIALSQNLEKIVAQMTTDQEAGIAIFEGLGFKAEALLSKYVKDRAGKAHDIVVLSHNVQEGLDRLNALGVLEATSPQ
jgi:L-amino acid N-acyltransferase YncA